MIIVNSFNKIDILYRNYVKQFSNAYIIGSPLYVGDSLKNSKYFHKCLHVQSVIKTYKNIFIQLYMNNNKVYEEVNYEDLCVICLEDLNEDIMNICHKCNIKCHIKCLYDWYKKNNVEICPVCLKTEEFYLNLLEESKKSHNETDETVETAETADETADETDNTIQDINIIGDNYNYVIVSNKIIQYCMVMMFLLSIILFINL